MKMKKFFKKLMTVALATALLSVGVKAEEAKAGTCNPHENYYNHVMTGRSVGYKHKVPLTVYGYDPYGNVYEIPVGYVECTVSFEELFYDIRCGKCHCTIGRGSYTTAPMHSICPVG